MHTSLQRIKTPCTHQSPRDTARGNDSTEEVMNSNRRPGRCAGSDEPPMNLHQNTEHSRCSTVVRTRPRCSGISECWISITVPMTPGISYAERSSHAKQYYTKLSFLNKLGKWPSPSSCLVILAATWLSNVSESSPQPRMASS
jgi:hypothetical protein